MNRTMKRLALVAAAVAVLTLATPVPKATGANLPEGWLTDLAQAKAKAKETGKPVLAVFSAEWCGPCQYMVKEVYPKPAVVEELKKWVPVYLDDAAAPKDHEAYSIEAYPTIVILSPEGVEEDRVRGGRPEPQFIRVLAGHGEYVKRMAKVEESLKTSPEDPALWKEKGDVLLIKDMYDEAIEAFRKAVSLDPDDKTGAKTDVEFFDIVTTRPENEEALAAMGTKLAAFVAAHPTSPHAPRAQLFRGFVAADLKKTSEAIALIEEGIAKYPGNPWIHDMKGVLEQMKASETAAAGAGK